MNRTHLPVLALTIISCSLSELSTPVTAQTLPTVISTGDGDTLRINRNGQAITIRLACIDAPEGNQPGGAESAYRLSQLLTAGQPVQVRTVDTDRYGREVAELYVNQQSVNLRMVQEGMAVVYRQYLQGCANTQNQYLQAEQQAREAQIGFWRQSQPMMPWDWRQAEQSNPPPRPATPSSPVTRPPNNRPTASLPACVNSDCDCADFATQAAAQQVLNAFPGDPFRLDGDGDRRACETLP